MSIVDDIKDVIVSKGTTIGGAVWQKTQVAIRNNSEAYAQALQDLAEGVESGEIDPDDVPKRAKLALDMFTEAVLIESAQILLSEVQAFLNAVISAAKTSINATLPFPVL